MVGLVKRVYSYLELLFEAAELGDWVLERQFLNDARKLLHLDHSGTTLNVHSNAAVHEFVLLLKQYMPMYITKIIPFHFITGNTQFLANAGAIYVFSVNFASQMSSTAESMTHKHRFFQKH